MGSSGTYRCPSGKETRQHIDEITMATFSVKALEMIITGAERTGVDVVELLAAVGINQALMSDPDARVPIALERALWSEAAARSGDPYLGLRVSDLFPLDSFGGLGFALRSSASVGEALSRFARFMGLVTDGPTLMVNVEQGQARIRLLWSEVKDERPSRHSLAVLMAFLLYLVERGLGVAYQPRAVRFHHKPPDSMAEYRRRFGPRVHFSQVHDEFVVDREVWEHPQVDAEPLLSSVLDGYLGTLLDALPKQDERLPGLRAALLAELSRGRPSLSTIAAYMAMSPRSLQRQLERCGSTLSGEFDVLRNRLARQQLTQSNRSIAEIAFMLGFSDTSAFYRAFKRWTGTTPGNYRRQGTNSSA